MFSKIKASFSLVKTAPLFVSIFLPFNSCHPEPVEGFVPEVHFVWRFFAMLRMTQKQKVFPLQSGLVNKLLCTFKTSPKPLSNLTFYF